MNFFAGCTVDLAGAKIQQSIDDAGRQRAVNPVDRIAKTPIAVKSPGERRLGCEIFPQLHVFVCPFDSFGTVFRYIDVVINEVMVVMDLAAPRRLQRRR